MTTKPPSLFLCTRNVNILQALWINHTTIVNSENQDGIVSFGENMQVILVHDCLSKAKAISKAVHQGSYSPTHANRSTSRSFKYRNRLSFSCWQTFYMFARGYQILRTVHHQEKILVVGNVLRRGSSTAHVSILWICGLVWRHNRQVKDVIRIPLESNVLGNIKKGNSPSIVMRHGECLAVNAGVGRLQPVWASSLTPKPVSATQYIQSCEESITREVRTCCHITGRRDLSMLPSPLQYHIQKRRNRRRGDHVPLSFLAVATVSEELP